MRLTILLVHTFELIIDFVEFQKIFLQKIKTKLPFIFNDFALTFVVSCLHTVFVSSTSCLILSSL